MKKPGSGRKRVSVVLNFFIICAVTRNQSPCLMQPLLSHALRGLPCNPCYHTLSALPMLPNLFIGLYTKLPTPPYTYFSNTSRKGTTSRSGQGRARCPHRVTFVNLHLYTATGHKKPHQDLDPAGKIENENQNYIFVYYMYYLAILNSTHLYRV